MKHDIKNFAAFDFKSVTEDGQFSGYASRFDEVDSGFDVVEKGAFAKTLQGRNLKDIKMLAHHNMEMPIGYYTDLKEDSTGLYFEGQVLTGKTQAATEMHELMKAGVVDGMSIGYRAKDYEIDRNAGVRRLKEIELVEISVVTLPMLKTARVAQVKTEDLTIREIERRLTQDAGFTRSQARFLMKDGASALVTHDASLKQQSRGELSSLFLNRATELLKGK